MTMATERRRPLHQRSNSQINSAGIKKAEDVSSSLASSQTLFNNLSGIGWSQPSRTDLFEASLPSKYNNENETAPSRGTSVTSKRTAKTDRSLSPEKKNGGKLALQVVSRNGSVKSSDLRIPSGPPPYTSYIASINAIGLPPSRPLPTPPGQSPVLLIDGAAEPLPSPALPKFPKPILKRPRTLQEIEASSPDVTPPINAAQFPEIQPALSWILETEQLKAPAPLKINKPKRARMQAPEDEGTRATSSHGGAKVNGLARFDTNSSQSVSEVGTSSSGSAPPPNVRNVKGRNPLLLRTDGFQSQRATVFSPAESSATGLRRNSSNPSYYNGLGVPEWARVYYGRGAPLPNFQEEDDDLAITTVQRPKPVHLQRINTHISHAGSIWMGTLNPEGRDLQDQFNQPRLENFPVNRSERFNFHLILACVGFVFPLAWFIGAFYPLPEQKRRERRERQEIRRAVQGVVAPPSRSSHVRGPSVTHYDDSVDTESLPSFTTFEEGRRWDNARWWRNVNRILSVFGILVIGAIIALLVVGLKRRHT
ncbi:hypothetical protein AA313_de0201330 [Arthrobotrys entomopaga]|nr:hypothetical protein AA313_de0201330 [Arthrobotrys entomopaga]